MKSINFISKILDRSNHSKRDFMVLVLCVISGIIIGSYSSVGSIIAGLFVLFVVGYQYLHRVWERGYK